MTFIELQAARTAAGEAYLSAAAALRAAYVELAALDRAVSSGVLHGASQPVRTFAEEPALPSHPDFPIPAELRPRPGDEIHARLEQLTA